MKSLTTLFLLLFINLSAFAETLEKPLLWKAEKDGKTAYLFGTTHIGFGLKDLPQKFFPLIDGSNLFMVETDPSELDEASLMEKMAYQGDDQTLDKFLPDEAWENLKNQLSYVPPATLNKLKPWGVSFGIIIPIVVQQLGLTGFLDDELLRYAESKSIPVGFFESDDLQLSMLEAVFSVEYFYEELTKYPSMLEAYRSQTLALNDCYKKADVDCIIETIRGELKDWQFEILVKQRNRTWIPVIEDAFHKVNQMFIAVGVGHLLGEDSVLDLLERRGYKVEFVQL